jgi:endonuclease/exonuclease/phosphatase family metal-dependent hydrolase
VTKYIVGLLCFAASPLLSIASLILSDNFDYPDGALVTQTGSPWTTSSGITGQVAVVSGRVFLSKTNTEDVQAHLSGQPYGSTAGAILYASFTLNCATLPSSAGDYFADFKNDATTFRGRIFVQTSGAGPGAYRLGVANGSGTVSAIYNSDLQPGINYTVVIRLGVSNAVSTLWINPSAETNAGVTAIDSISGASITAFGFREGGSAMGNLFVDNLLVGTTFSDVVTNAPMLTSPSITAPPMLAAVFQGMSATFSVTATGTPPLAYQWRFQRTNLPAATNPVLVITNADFAQAGAYRVIVSNVLGSVESTSVTLSIWSSNPSAISLLQYNLHGNGTTNWSTNTFHVKAIGRQVQYLNPDIMTFQEVPVTNNSTAQMTNFVAAFRPGFYLATNSADDGFIHSAILSRYPIIASRSWLHDSDLIPFGYAGLNHFYTRDLFEAEIAVPGFPQHLHVFTVHLKSGAGSSDDSAKRAAEAGAVSNFFATAYLSSNSLAPYLLTGDMNEDIANPSTGSQQPIQHLISAPTGLQMTVPFNPFTTNELTFSIEALPLTKRYDYILPNGLLFSNVAGSQVFRTDLLPAAPPPLLAGDDATASDHLPVFMVFANPYAAPFHFLSIGRNGSGVTLCWQSVPGQSYCVERSSDLVQWSTFVDHLLATNGTMELSTNGVAACEFFRVRRLP